MAEPHPTAWNIPLGDRHIELFIQQLRVVARLDGVERDTGIVSSSAPPDWPAIEVQVLRWIELKQPW